MAPAPSAAPAVDALPEPPLVGRQEQRAEIMDAVELAIAGAGWRAARCADPGLNGLSYVYGLRKDYARAREVIRQGLARAEASPRLLDRAFNTLSTSAPQ